MTILYIFTAIIGIIVLAISLKTIAFVIGKKKTHKKFPNHYETKIKDLGSISSLKITPIVDFYATDDNFQTEPGVSYWIEADDTNILLDVGFNAKKQHPSPFLHNLNHIGKSLEDLDMIFFSHLHLDHVGGMKEQRKKQFSFSAGESILPNIPIYAPEPLTPSAKNPGKDAVVLTEPTKIAQGIASTGAVAKFFLLGQTLEHALAINIKGKGLAIIVGCGHQTIEKILEMAKENFEEPVFAIIGGLHYPVKDGRIMVGPLNMQGIAATENKPLSGITQTQLDSALNVLEKSNVKKIYLSAHDSSDYALDQFAKRFDKNFETLQVGKTINISQ